MVIFCQQWSCNDHFHLQWVKKMQCHYFLQVRSQFEATQYGFNSITHHHLGYMFSLRNYVPFLIGFPLRVCWTFSFETSKKYEYNSGHVSLWSCRPILLLIRFISSLICTSFSWILPALITGTTGLRFNLIDSSVMKTNQVRTFSSSCWGTLKLSKYVLKLTARLFSNTPMGSSEEQVQSLSASIQYFSDLSCIYISGWSCRLSELR